MTWLTEGIELPFTSGFSVSRSRQLSNKMAVNYRPNIPKTPSLSVANLYQTEGIDQIVASVTNAPTRGSHTMNGVPYYVIGDRLYRIDRTVAPDLTVTYSAVNLGQILGENRVVMKSIWSGTGYEMAIVDPGNYAFSYREATGLIEDLSTKTNFLSPVDDVASINGFMIFLQTDTNKVFHSNLNDVSTYNATDFELITRTSRVVGLQAFRDQLYVMGEYVTLPYVFIGGANFVFRYQVNSAIPTGLENVWAKTAMGRNFAFLGGGENESPAVWLSSGGAPTKISDETIEYLIRGNSLLSSSYLFNFSIDGGEYIAFQIGDYCFVYDRLTNLWHTRTSINNTVPWRVNSVTDAYGELLVGDAIDGRIGILSDSNTTYSEPTYRTFTIQPFDNRGKFIQVKSVLLAVDAGFDGEITMDYSDDGFNFSDPVTASAGEIGDYGRQVVWDRLGTTPYSRVFRFGTTSNALVNVNKVLAR